MSFGGRLETLDLSALLQTLSVGAASGRLTLTRLERHAVLVLRSGRVVYATGGSPAETLAGRLLREKLVGEADLMKALERQYDGTGFKRLGEVLVEMGLLAEGTLKAVVRRRMEELITELLAWRSGFFRFEPATGGTEANVEVDLGDFVIPGGLAPQELLMRAVTALDSGDLSRLPPPESTMPPLPPDAPEAPPRPSPTGSYAVDFTGEAVLSLLRFASQLLGRAVVFSVAGDTASGVGEFGVRLAGGRSGAVAVRETVLTLREPSILRAAVERRRTYVGPLEPTRVNLALAERLGGAEVREAVAVPLLVGGEVRFVLYGDNAPTGQPLGPLDTLDSAAARAARIVEKTLLARAKEGPGRSD
ncbi:MAG TPA: DUF4388 domain-containing protein [Vicinamibacteria bacterium]|nr:DUF4388 domain-containing protein [Vicinamibacteria bacterium]